jgi:PAS domain S-box-containing protein
MRIGELARRTGVGVSTLRAWERRFGFPRPERSETGQRLYGEEDVAQVVAVGRLVAEGLTLSSAVGRVAAAGARAPSSDEAETFLLHQIVQAADQGIWVSQDARTRYANRRMAELMGCTVDDLMSRSVLDFVDPENLDVLREHGHLVRDGHRQRYEIPLRRLDGTAFLAEVSSTPLRDNAGAYKGAVAVVTDVTAQRAAESEATFRNALLDAIGEAVMAAGPDGRILYANTAAERLFGWRAADLIGQRGVKLFPAPDAGEDAHAMHTRLLAKEPQTAELELARRDGSRFPAHVIGTPVLDDNGELVGLIGVISDNSERDRLEHEVRGHEQRAETVALLASRALNRSDRDALLIEAVGASRRVLQADHAAVLELGAARDELVVRVASPAGGDVRVMPSGSRSLAGYAALAGHVIAVDDARTDRRFDVPASADGEPPVVSAIAAPIHGASGVCGVLVATRTTRQPFNPSATHFMQSIANVVGIALQQP